MSSMIPTRQPSPDLSRPQTMTSTAQAGHHYGHKRQSSVSSVASATSSTLSREDLKVSILYYSQAILPPHGLTKIKMK